MDCVDVMESICILNLSLSRLLLIVNALCFVLYEFSFYDAVGIMYPILSCAFSTVSFLSVAEIPLCSISCWLFLNSEMACEYINFSGCREGVM